jgi:nucleoside-diphosphate-sugar epimerase
MTRARAGTLVQIGPGTNRVDLTHIDNAALAHLRALEALFHNPSCVAGKAYFISDGAPVVLWQWVAALLARYQLPAVRRCVPFAAAYALGWLAEGFCRSVACFGTPSMPTMTRFVATQLAKSHWFKIDRARELLGYEPLQRDLSSLPACVEG